MALLTANANQVHIKIRVNPKRQSQLRILMVMKDLCEKIKWEQTRTLETGQVVTTGCEGNVETHSHLFLFLANSLA